MRSELQGLGVKNKGNGGEKYIKTELFLYLKKKSMSLLKIIVCSFEYRPGCLAVKNMSASYFWRLKAFVFKILNWYSWTRCVKWQSKDRLARNCLAFWGGAECWENGSRPVGGSLHFEMRPSVLALYQYSGTAKEHFHFHRKGEFEELQVTDLTLWCWILLNIKDKESCVVRDHAMKERRERELFCTADNPDK